MTLLTYPVVMEPLPADERGGFLALVPDLPGCMSDGESPEKAVANVQDAIETWIEAANDVGARDSRSVSALGIGSGAITDGRGKLIFPEPPRRRE